MTAAEKAFDRYGRVIYCDKHLDRGTFLIDTSGELWCNFKFDGDSISMAYGISDLKSSLKYDKLAGLIAWEFPAIDIDKISKNWKVKPNGVYVRRK